jgi:hypothetical protein
MTTKVAVGAAVKVRNGILAKLRANKVYATISVAMVALVWVVTPISIRLTGGVKMGWFDYMWCSLLTILIITLLAHVMNGGFQRTKNKGGK